MRIIFFAGMVCLAVLANPVFAQDRQGAKINFNKNWKFFLGEDQPNAKNANFDDSKWRVLNLPHDWSIELPFDSASPTGNGGGALRGGLGWYRKTFILPASDNLKHIFVDFDGVYRNSEVWINGHYLGLRPNGYISFQYELTQWLKFGKERNVIAVRVDNSKQPNSRWYSGSGIYRNTWLETKNNLYIKHWGTSITTPVISESAATVNIQTTFNNPGNADVSLTTIIYDHAAREVARLEMKPAPLSSLAEQNFSVLKPELWSDDHPQLYTAKTILASNGVTRDESEVQFGIRSFNFDGDKGFFLNGKPLKIRGVCDHHDLGCLGTAVNYRAIERKLEILKGMGCNAIRTSHNSPAPELLELADEMGFIIMDETFDMWQKPKNPYDYHLDWEQWHIKDLQDQVMRDRNHPSVFIWSLGNEIPEQWAKDGDSTGEKILAGLQETVRALDKTRPTVTANDQVGPWNRLIKSKMTDLVGYNYHHRQWPADSVKQLWGNRPFIATESVSALETRGQYDLFPADSIRRWPHSWDKPCDDCSPDLKVNAYDDVSAPWGSTHEESMKMFKRSENVSGQFIWTGFDYIGEPTPFPWPARSSYFGIIDLAGFPKDVYYLYAAEWTGKPVLHILPHWNWRTGDSVDVWAYYNNADEVELFINGKSVGVRKKVADELHVSWRVKYEAGSLKAISKNRGVVVLTSEVKTAGKPARIILTADRTKIKSDASDLSYLTATVVDKDGTVVPDADNLILFSTSGNGKVISTDNGLQTSLEPFKSNTHKAFNGLCLAVVQSNEESGEIKVTASSAGLGSASVMIKTAR